MLLYLNLPDSTWFYPILWALPISLLFAKYYPYSSTYSASASTTAYPRT